MSQHLQYKLEPWFEPLFRKKLSTRTIHSILAIGGRGSSPKIISKGIRKHFISSSLSNNEHCCFLVSEWQKNKSVKILWNNIIPWRRQFSRSYLCWSLNRWTSGHRTNVCKLEKILHNQPRKTEKRQSRSWHSSSNFSVWWFSPVRDDAIQRW